MLKERFGINMSFQPRRCGSPVGHFPPAFWTHGMQRVDPSLLSISIEQIHSHKPSKLSSLWELDARSLREL